MPRPATSSAGRPKSFRTTVSIKEPWAGRLRALAEASEKTTLAQVIEQAVKQFVQFEELSTTGSETPVQARRLVEASGELTNPFQSIVARWRIGWAVKQVDEVAKFHLALDASPPTVYLFRILTSLLEKLSQNDEYLVVTTPGFWHHAATDDLVKSRGDKATTDYLDAQMNAVGRGVLLHRVFLLDERDSTIELRRHRDFLREARSRFPENASNVHVEARSAAGLRSANPFVFIRRRLPQEVHAIPEERYWSMVVEPYYGPSNVVVDIRLAFSADPDSENVVARDSMDRFVAATKGAKSVDKLVG